MAVRHVAFPYGAAAARLHWEVSQAGARPPPSSPELKLAGTLWKTLGTVNSPPWGVPGLLGGATFLPSSGMRAGPSPPTATSQLNLHERKTRSPPHLKPPAASPQSKCHSCHVGVLGGPQQLLLAWKQEASQALESRSAGPKGTGA